MADVTQEQLEQAAGLVQYAVDHADFPKPDPAGLSPGQRRRTTDQALLILVSVARQTIPDMSSAQVDPVPQLADVSMNGEGE